MKVLISCCLLLVSSCWCQNIVSKPSGSQTIAQPSGTEFSVNRFESVRYADQFPGSPDMGAQVNNAIADCSGSCTVIIPSGSWSVTNTIMMHTPGISLVGAGSGATVLTYNGTGDAILWQMNPFGVTPAGRIRGLTIHGNSLAASGIHSGTIIGAAFDDLQIDNFTGSGSSCMWLENVNGGFSERNVLTRVSLGSASDGTKGCTKGLRMSVNGGTNSFGYNRILDLRLNVNADQIGISSEGDLSTTPPTPVFLYSSTLIMTCNANGAVTACVSLSPESNWDGNLYDITAEGTVSNSVAVEVASGSQLRGYGVLNVGSMVLSNQNGGTWGGTFRIAAVPNVSQDGGTISNFLGSGEAAQVIPSIPFRADDPDGFGFISANNIVSPYAAMYNHSGNAFVVGTLTFGQAPSTMTQVARIDTGGNVHAKGAFFANGSDYAESIKIAGDRKKYSPGDLLVVDSSSPSHFVLSSQPYSTAIAGIYSTRPGVLGSSHSMDVDHSSDEVPMAVNGIVPCKVSAENGTVKPGDLLVSSSTPGYAMKGTDRTRMTGAIIGKALEGLEEKTGVISVLISHD